MTIGYDELYGVSLDVYLDAHGTTIDAVINKIDTDIALLNSSLTKVLLPGLQNMTSDKSHLLSKVQGTILKKQKHKERLLEWKNQ